MATASNTFADLVALWVDRGFRGTPPFTRKRRADGEFEAFVRAPRGAMADCLSITTYRGDLWVRLGPPHSFYPVGSQRELVYVVRHVMRDRALFVLTYKDDVWTGTTIVTRGARPVVRRGEVAHVLSWSGRFDERVEAVSRKRSNQRVKPVAASRRKARTRAHRG